MEYIDIAELVILLLIAKHLFIYERYKISVSFKYKSVYLLKWNYHDCQFYRTKTIIKL